MKKTLLSVVLFLTSLATFAQIPPADFPDGAEGSFFGLFSNTQSEINTWTVSAGTTRIAWNVTTSELQWYNGTTWVCISCSGTTTTLQEAIAEDPVATSVPEFRGGISVGNTGLSQIEFAETSGSTLSSNSGGLNLQHPSSINLISDVINTGVGRVLSLDFSSWNASTNSPDLTNPYFQKEGYLTVVSVAGTQDLGNGNITFGVGDVVCYLNGDYFKLVDNNQSGLGGNTSDATDEGVFTGELDFSNEGGTYYDTYDLATDGQITFSIGANPKILKSAYLPIISDGVTEFATQANLDAIFHEQYGIPSDRILDAGVHYLYMIKTPPNSINPSGSASISLPINNYVADVIAPTVESATILNGTPDELEVVYSESVNVTNTVGQSLDNDLSGLTIDSIISGNGTSTITYQLSGNANSGDAGDYIYSVSNTVEDLSGNGLVSGTTTVTNNIAGTLAYTLFNFTESTNNYTKNAGGSGLTTAYATSTTSFSGAFDYTVEIENANSAGSLIAISTNGTNRAFNTAPAYEMGVYITPVNTIRKVENGSASDNTVTETATYVTGDTLRISRDGSNIVRFYKNATLLHTFGSPLSGNVFLHFSNNNQGNIVYNPTFTQN